MKKNLRKSKLVSKLLLVFFFTQLLFLFAWSQNKKEINIYSFRQKFLIKPILDRYTQKTGVKINVIFAKKGLIERIKLEGKNSQADVILATDISQLIDLKKSGVLQKVNNSVINKTIPPIYRDSQGYWFGLTTRARIIFASKDRVADGAITSYEELALPKWQGKICTRSGYHPYNIALFASVAAHSGIDKAKEWLIGFKKNLARKPQGNDRAQVKAIKEGVCDLSIGNTYYYGKMYYNEKSPEQKEWARAVKLIFPNQANRGTHINISGMALAKYAPHRKSAIQFMKYLVSKEAQYLYAAENFEFPINSKVSYSDFLKENMSGFKWDEISLEKITPHRNRTVKLLDTIKFDD